MFLELFNNTNMMWYFVQVRIQKDIPVYERILQQKALEMENLGVSSNCENTRRARQKGVLCR